MFSCFYLIFLTFNIILVQLLFFTSLFCVIFNHSSFCTSGFYACSHRHAVIISFLSDSCATFFSYPNYSVLFWILLLPILFSHPSNSSALSSCHNRVYQSLANLIRWADQVMLDGIDLEDKENVASVTSVIKAVLDGVKVGPSLEKYFWMVPP